jgi:hypothetical protein
LIKKKVFIYWFFIAVISAFACNHKRQQRSESKDADSLTDTVNFRVTYSNTVFCIPSPQLTNMYFKQLGIYPDRTLVNPLKNVEKYTTSSKKAINLGVFGVDLGYMNMFTVSESTNDYVTAISQISGDIGLRIVFTREVYDRVMSLKNNQDSLAQYLSKLFANTDIYLKNNSQQQISALVITGGWIESFFLLCTIYSQTKNKDLLPFLYQQKFVLDNIIKNLAPYYNTSKEMAVITDDLIEIAYDFDILDFKYSYNNPLYLFRNDVMIIQNSCKIDGNESGLKNILEKIDELRYKITS